MTNDPEARLRAAYRDRAASAPSELGRNLPDGFEQPPNAIRQAPPGWLVPSAVVVAVLAVLAAAGVFIPLLSDNDDSDEPASWSSNGITLNTSSWQPGDDKMQALSVSVVRIDPKGCVYLDSKWSDGVRNVIWPAGYTASRQTDGTVTISNPDGAVVAATGHILRAGGGEAPSETDLAYRAQGSTDMAFMIQDELPQMKP